MTRIEFDTSFVGVDRHRRARHGLPWDDDDYRGLEVLAKSGESLKMMCEALQRPAEGVLSKLVSRKYIALSPEDGRYYYTFETPKMTSSQKDEPVMTKPLIESKVFVNGADAARLSDSEIFSLIANTEGEIAKLKSIKTPSKKLAAAISKLEADVIKLAEYVDSRD